MRPGPAFVGLLRGKSPEHELPKMPSPWTQVIPVVRELLPKLSDPMTSNASRRKKGPKAMLTQPLTNRPEAPGARAFAPAASPGSEPEALHAQIALLRQTVLSQQTQLDAL